jgi:hypothetical protein
VTSKPHYCHARGCSIPVPPRLLMCRKHWAMVPRHLQARVYAEYCSGQERTKTPSRAYLQAALDAINAVEAQEKVSRSYL